MNGKWAGETAGHALDASARWATGVALPTVCCARSTDEPVVGLTFDDGPHPELTDDILDVLARHEAQATFFLIGDRVVGNEGVVTRIVEEGHEVGDHLMRDEASILLSRSRFREDLTQARDLLAEYQEVRWWRPGSGWTTPGTARPYFGAGSLQSHANLVKLSVLRRQRRFVTQQVKRARVGQDLLHSHGHIV